MGRSAKATASPANTRQWATELPKAVTLSGQDLPSSLSGPSAKKTPPLLVAGPHAIRWSLAA